MSDFLTVDEYADLLRVHPQTVYRALRAGRIAFFRVGKRYRIPRP